MQVLVTGANGTLGPPIIAELLRCEQVDRVVALLRPHPHQKNHEQGCQLRSRVARYFTNSQIDAALNDRLLPIFGDLAEITVESLPCSISHVVHAAAITRLQAAEEELQATNVQGTRHMLRLANSLPNFCQFVHISTHCVAGKTTGVIPEVLREESPLFVNRYERSKWEAEQLVAKTSVPARIIRLTTCLGDESGEVQRAGGVHLALDWLYRGLIPMTPGTPETPVDLISNEFAARVIAKGAMTPVSRLDVCQAAAGSAAPRLCELLNLLVEIFCEQSAAWRRRQILPPPIVGADTFDEFRRSVQHSRDSLFLQVLDAVETLLAPLLYPRIYETLRAEALWGGPLPLVDWRQLVRHVVEQRIAKTKQAGLTHA
jgi:long-chain acyl-CoA synthetase